MIIDYRGETPVNCNSHVAVDAETGEDLSYLHYVFADDEAGLLIVNELDGAGNPFMCDPTTRRRPTMLAFRSGRDADGRQLYDYGDGYITADEPVLAQREVRRPIRIVARDRSATLSPA